MPVNISEKIFFAQLEAAAKVNPPKPLSEQTLTEFREGVKNFINFAGAPAQVPYTEQTIPARDGYLIPIRIYNHNLPENSPVLIMFPGCGYVSDLYECNAIFVSRIASYVPIRVIIVNFRLVPEYPLPTAIYDGFDVTQYVATHASEFGINPNQVLVGGLSSGGHCAATITNLAKKNCGFKIFHQILINSSLDLQRAYHEYDEYEKEDKMLTQEVVTHIYKIYGLSPKDHANPLFSPYYDDLTGLPSTTIVVGEYDGVRNDSEAYYIKLKASGNQVEKILLPGQTHNAPLLRGVLPDDEDPAMVIANVVQERIKL